MISVVVRSVSEVVTLTTFESNAASDWVTSSVCYGVLSDRLPLRSVVPPVKRSSFAIVSLFPTSHGDFALVRVFQCNVSNLDLLLMAITRVLTLDST